MNEEKISIEGAKASTTGSWYPCSAYIFGDFQIYDTSTFRWRVFKPILPPPVCIRTMHRRQRTVPRSTPRTAATRSPPSAIVAEKAGTGGRYAPKFEALPRDSTAAQPPLRTGVEAVSPVTAEAALCYGSAPLSVVRWLPDTTSHDAAVAVTGTCDGSVDELSMYEIRVRHCVESKLVSVIPHSGKVTTIVPDSSGLFVGSSDGHVRMLSHDAELHIVAALPARGYRLEQVAAVAPLRGAATMVFGSDGTVLLADTRGGDGVVVTSLGDAIGFRAACAAGDVVVAGAASSYVSVWDCNGNRVQTLHHDVRGTRVASITVDPAQPHFVLGGTDTGELSIWDRRGNVDAPLSRIEIHNGPVWDLHVVDSRPGLLLSCGEDAKVSLLDFFAASGRAAMGAASEAWCDAGEHWRAQLTQSDVRDVSGRFNGLAINSVAAHPVADLYAFASDAASVTFGCLYH